MYLTLGFWGPAGQEKRPHPVVKGRAATRWGNFPCSEVLASLGVYKFTFKAHRDKFGGSGVDCDHADNADIMILLTMMGRRTIIVLMTAMLLLVTPNLLKTGTATSAALASCACRTKTKRHLQQLLGLI